MQDTAEQEMLAGRAHIIERPRLTRLLDDTAARVIMLVAPAGYGKTTLARQWLADRPHAWYQGGPSSPDVAALGLGLAEASESLLSDVGRRLREWLPTSRSPEEEVHIIEQFLSEDLATWPDDAWFVVDDYHMLTSGTAENLIQRLFVSRHRRLLLTSRQRPVWASARALLYGNVFELGPNALAMNLQEANTILASSHAEAASGLVALADGWPAVIGLAALTPTAIRLDDDSPDELHEYFAEELLASLPEDIRDGLCQLALVPVVSRPAAEAILGDTTNRVVTAAREAGLLTPHHGHELTLNPLLRTFLKQKLMDAERSQVADTVKRATQYLIGAESWDDAFSLISEFERHDLLDCLLARAVIPLTRQGRLTTIREWLEFARRHELTSPLVDLADAEFSFRLGLYDRAELLAQNAAKAMAAPAHLRSTAWYRAGQSCLLVDEPGRALRHFKAAHGSADAPVDLRNALWGEFIASLELERRDAQKRLDEFAAISPHDRDTGVRLASGRLFVATRTGGLVSALSQAAAMRDLVSEGTDPIARSGFRHIYAAALALAGDYTETLEAVEEALLEIDSSNIEFARSHALLSRALAYIGLRRYRPADKTLTEIEDSARKRRDDYVLTNARALRCRLLLQTAHPNAAVALMSQDWPRTPSSSMQAEFLATKAAALACAGRPEAALDLARRAQTTSISLEPRLLAEWVRTICALLLDRADVEMSVRATYESTKSAGALDTFVLAYRLHSGILESLTCDNSLREPLTRLLVRVNDTDRATAAGLDVPRDERKADGLTKREGEVYVLLGEGKSNREIAQTLFISEATAKVHVRNVLRKLGVRTRTEAALKAVRDEIGR